MLLWVRLFVEREIAGAFQGGDLTKVINILTAYTNRANNSTSEDWSLRYFLDTAKRKRKARTEGGWNGGRLGQRLAAWIGWLEEALAPACKRTRVESWAGLAKVTYRYISVTIPSWMGVIEGAGCRQQARAWRGMRRLPSALLFTTPWGLLFSLTFLFFVYFNLGVWC